MLEWGVIEDRLSANSAKPLSHRLIFDVVDYQY